MAHDVTQATVRYAATHKFATVAVVPTDADGTAEGHQVDLSAGRNEVTITVTAQNGDEIAHTLGLNRGVNTDFGWKAVDDFDTLLGADNTAATGIWSNGTTMWVADATDSKIYAYTVSTKRETPPWTSTPCKPPAMRPPSASGPTARPCGCWMCSTP